LKIRTTRALCALTGLLFALVFIFGCAPQYITYPQVMLREADSLFAAGNYEYAKIKYTKIRDKYEDTPAGRIAQYRLGYVNVYYENAFSNWEAALREFKRFASRYQNHELIGEVNSWIRLLVVLESFKTQYVNKSEQLQDILKQTAENARNERPEGSYEILIKAVNKCYSDRDSLLEQIKLLNEVIESIE